MCHNCGMTKVWRLRIDQKTLKRANQVTERIGTSTQELVRIFVTKIAQTGRVPLELNTDDDLVLDKKRRNRLLASLDDSQGW
jgi:addiction module RelB/DinJ family antitoxin